ncbi:helix-turn-helix domain-containing protein [Actinomadura barringtoniae]|uniref:Helix-turn-helix domain-containing protein n=1 Tax=Actinomadura barringtoniae TaxID=1427535 RepID=A0A939T3E2_9ACTN|nr:helix-turn-helix domain-containing protein [Actinomadura barringtoniae]MBO2447983.1 helix-turn-helix domain-containing protein [Actinomadura barringtoniae]
MTRIAEPRELDRLMSGVSRQLVPLFRPEIPAVAEEIFTAVRRAIPDYDTPLDRPRTQALRFSVEHAVLQFVTRMADPSPADDFHEDTYRRLGRYMADEGRGLDDLHTAYRIGTDVAWRRAVSVAARNGVPPDVVATFGDALFAFRDRLTALSREGHLNVRPGEARSGLERDAHRRLLLRALLRRPAAPPDEIARLEGPAQWKVPAEVTPVSLPPGRIITLPPGMAAARGTIASAAWSLDEDVLADVAGEDPCLIVPGPVGEGRSRALGEALPGIPLALGTTMPVANAADSMRWARRTRDLVAAGVIEAGPDGVTRAGDHLFTLWLQADGALMRQLEERRLGRLNRVEGGLRRRLTETLSCWLRTRGTAERVGRDLDVHPQTVRYRLRLLRTAVGMELDDPEVRFSVEVALRAAELRGAELRSTEPEPEPAAAEQRDRAS